MIAKKTSDVVYNGIQDAIAKIRHARRGQISELDDMNLSTAESWLKRILKRRPKRTVM